MAIDDVALWWTSTYVKVGHDYQPIGCPVCRRSDRWKLGEHQEAVCPPGAHNIDEGGWVMVWTATCTACGFVVKADPKHARHKRRR
jgi:Fe-S-cluster-containing dehydrogenase component